MMMPKADDPSMFMVHIHAAVPSAIGRAIHGAKETKQNADVAPPDARNQDCGQVNWPQCPDPGRDQPGQKSCEERALYGGLNRCHSAPAVRRPGPAGDGLQSAFNCGA
jgi:hypothetical protein